MIDLVGGIIICR